MTFQPDTALIHHSYQPPADFEAPQVPVCKASTVFFPSVAAMRERTWLDKSAYTYGLHGTPTSYVLEERLCALEGGRYAVLVPSGLAAIACVNLALLRMGDEVLIPDNAMAPARRWQKVNWLRGASRTGTTIPWICPISNPSSVHAHGWSGWRRLAR